MRKYTIADMAFYKNRWRTKPLRLWYHATIYLMERGEIESRAVDELLFTKKESNIIASRLYNEGFPLTEEQLTQKEFAQALCVPGSAVRKVLTNHAYVGDETGVWLGKQLLLERKKRI